MTSCSATALFRTWKTGHVAPRSRHRDVSGTIGTRRNQEKNRIPKITATLTRLCQRYTQLKNADPTSDELKELEHQIENLDTCIRVLQKGMATVIAAVVYLYYRQGLNSVAVGELLHLKPPHVRQLVWRIKNFDFKNTFSQETRDFHFARLTELTAQHDGILPPMSWLRENGFKNSYNVVMKAGLLSQFKRADNRASRGLALQVHLAKLTDLSQQHDGILPGFTWLKANGFVNSYHAVRRAGLLGQFKRAFGKPGVIAKGECRRAPKMKVKKKNIDKHFDRLSKLARMRGGVLPSYRWLNENGYFHSYDVVRAAGLLDNFKRADLRRGPKAA